MLEKDLELFEDYIQDSLSAKDKIEFEQRLTSEPEFKSNFNAYEKTTFSLAQKFSDEERNAFKKNIAQQSDAYFKTAERQKKSFNLYKYAAAFVVLVSAIGFYMLNSSSPVYADYATIDTIALTQRSSSNDLAKKAENAFNTKAFKEASTYLNELIVQDPTNQELKLYYAIASIENNAFTNALESLTTVAQGNSVYKHEAQWYIALTFLKQKEYDKAKTALEKIPENAPEFDKANKLYKKL